MRDVLGRRLPLPVLDKSFPYWYGDTADAILAARAKEQKDAPKRGSKRRSSSSRSSTPLNGPPDLIKRIRRLERNLPRRKTHAARLRIENELKKLKAELESK